MTHTILIIDDNPDDVEIAEITLARLDRELKVETAPRGDDALDLLRNGKALPSLILLDLKMPGMSGFDVLRNIRADKRTKLIPVIIVTSSTLEADEKASYEAGANGFLHKAFDINRFSSDLKSLLHKYMYCRLNPSSRTTGGQRYQ